jgi:hypothetical protein
MFGNRDRDEKIKTLTQELDRLRGRVQELEGDCAPIRLGDVTFPRYGLYPYEDKRPKVSLHDVAMRLMEHCGLRFEKTPVTGGEIVVKDKKDDLMFVQSGHGTVATSPSVLEALKHPKPRKKRNRRSD